MKLARCGPPGAERPALVVGGRLRDASQVIDDIEPSTIESALHQLSEVDPTSLPPLPADSRIGPPVGAVGKVVGVGLNYREHANESAMDAPTEPLLFLKSPTSIIGPHDDIELPATADRVDPEIELGVVIGTTARSVPAAAALSHVAGYCIVNDVTDRTWQLDRGGGWTKGKSFDGFCPVGPWLVTPDELPDIATLDMQLAVDGHIRQDASTSNLVTGIADLISYISGCMTLVPGDIITTGTPAGTALGRETAGTARDAAGYLQPGQHLELSITGLGRQRNTVAFRTAGP